ncbi:MAG: UMP kinase [Candidatus Eremiobacteraeota bacterium]|nr:UMP kinase [Candidatus Eremiobacteraeota bacterium]
MYRRVILKLSGEVLSGPGGPLDSDRLKIFVKEIASVVSSGAQVGIVLGGGNLIRGRSSGGDRVHADRMGMLATILNGLAFQEELQQRNIPCQLFSALKGEAWLEPYDRDNAVCALESGKVAIFAGGTGLPFLSTDTAAALRGLEIQADALLKITRVKGVYDKDPEKYPDAIFFPELTYKEVLEKRLGIMDLTAISLCMEFDLPIIVFSMFETGNLERVMAGEKIGSIIRG